MEVERRLQILDEERAKEAAKHAQEAAAAAAAATQRPPEVPEMPAPKPDDHIIKVFLREHHALRKEVETAQGKFEDARRKGTPEEISEAGKALKSARAQKRQHYNLSISRCA